jgi:ketosteroid isomerase-like protein
MTRFTRLVGPFLIFFSACQPPAETLGTADRHANQAITDTFVQHLLARNLDALAALFVEDAVVMPPNQNAVVGRSAIRQWQADFPPLGEFRAINDVIDGSGNVAYVRGRYVLRLAIAGAPADSGKYVEIRRRQPDGSWRIVIDMFNSNRALPSHETVRASNPR